MVPRPRVSRSRLVLAAGLATVLVGSTAGAALAAPTLCLPDVTGGGPHWWTPGGAATASAQLDAGATMSRTTSGREATVHLLWDGAHERVMARVVARNLPSLEPAHDEFLLALSNADGDRPELLIRVRPLAGCTEPADCDGNGVAIPGSAIEYSAASGVTSLTWSPLSTTDPSAAFEVGHPWVAVETEGVGTTAVHHVTVSFALRVPVDAAGEIRPNLRVYGDFVDHVPGVTSATKVELPVLCQPSSPTSDDCLVYDGALASVPADLPVGNLVASWPRLASACPTFDLATPRSRRR